MVLGKEGQFLDINTIRKDLSIICKKNTLEFWNIALDWFRRKLQTKTPNRPLFLEF